jgi:hypothetical protein
MRFSSFIDKKNARAREELEIIRDILGEGGLKVDDFLKSDNPYLFLSTPQEGLNFEGVRIYKVGSNLAYRIQNESDTEPYGKAYSLNLEEVFSDLISDMTGEEAAEKIKEAVVDEFKNFFKKSSEAQEELNSTPNDPQNKIIVNGSAGDLSNSM